MLKIREKFKTERWALLGRARGRIVRVDKLFLVTVVAPVALAVLYFGFLASDVYISESQFVVQSPERSTTTGLGALLQSTGFSRAREEVYAAQDYVRSRDALAALNDDGSVVQAYSRPEISVFDRFNAFGRGGSFEDLYNYYRGKVDIQYDSVTSIGRLTVRAFDPNDAHQFNRELLELMEAVVNRMNTRGRADIVDLARREASDAEIAARSAAVNLARFRNTHGVVDPEQQAKIQLDMVSKLQDELIGARMQLLQLQRIAPDNPQIPILTTRIQGLSREIDEQMGRAAGSRRSLSQSAVQYERLELERQIAERRLTAAMSSLQEAQNEARRQQVYVERIAQPNLPDEAAEPRRLRGIIATLLLGLLAWGILRLLIAGVREHQA